MKKERIDKIIASQTALSRKEVVKYIRLGALTVNGTVILSPDSKASPEEDEIIFRGNALSYQRHIYIMMNKPKGILSASSDKRAETVVDLLSPEFKSRNLFPAGRLDKDTTGFILLTDDGEFSHEILSPKNHIYKTYEAKLKNSLTEDEKAKLESGITLKDGQKFMPCKINYIDGRKDFIEIKLHEGKFHQIKRMLKFVDNEVLDLKRTKLGKLTIDNALNEGKYRLLSPNEVQLIRDFDE